jgi:hypothetical protein
VRQHATVKPISPAITPIVLADAAAVAERVAALLLEDRLRPERTLGLATGRTMEPVYASLARRLGRLEPALAASRFDIRERGAKGDGQALDTAAIHVFQNRRKVFVRP